MIFLFFLFFLPSHCSKIITQLPPTHPTPPQSAVDRPRMHALALSSRLHYLSLAFISSYDLPSIVARCLSSRVYIHLHTCMNPHNAHAWRMQQLPDANHQSKDVFFRSPNRTYHPQAKIRRQSSRADDENDVRPRHLLSFFGSVGRRGLFRSRSRLQRYSTG